MQQSAHCAHSSRPGSCQSPAIRFIVKASAPNEPGPSLYVGCAWSPLIKTTSPRAAVDRHAVAGRSWSRKFCRSTCGGPRGRACNRTGPIRPGPGSG